MEETKRRVDLEIAKLRSQDSHQSEVNIKKQMNSLMYVRKLCITTMRTLKTGAAPDSMLNMVSSIVCMALDGGVQKILPTVVETSF